MPEGYFDDLGRYRDRPSEELIRLRESESRFYQAVSGLFSFDGPDMQQCALPDGTRVRIFRVKEKRWQTDISGLRVFIIQEMDGGLTAVRVYDLRDQGGVERDFFVGDSQGFRASNVSPETGAVERSAFLSIPPTDDFTTITSELLRIPFKREGAPELNMLDSRLVVSVDVEAAVFKKIIDAGTRNSDRENPQNLTLVGSFKREAVNSIRIVVNDVSSDSGRHYTELVVVGEFSARVGSLLPLAQELAQKYRDGTLNGRRPFLYGIATRDSEGELNYELYRLVKKKDDYSLVRVF